ncbi:MULTISPECIES: TetR/AcrR family transcriptional regulator [Aliivibrio]|uniref:TetR/AcrR family transcriptional regulator n=1 Tax=Aliivibrio finisterrensis TaxID=511998 RepID=A0A4Q5KVT5_9GAMM|nr:MULTISPECIES: TetR-like C-terminal domain-containing protein [Aliivibrio]MDD9174759.1 TetR-like C-terminal domain-containing protein [Aliivibrio sp. S3TY1]MDD9179050.1 TetR-like C-terminal domain-containing protein [Aliivibrio sp. A6]MDD9191838.1 TetR-like C-terminal domain-containing protein [Aliivibrio sp. S2TY2]RYU48709.1 TetR/AcrR family transcriptional regulator [Aliivibrio finisterrensis]RYU51514.1 TetR/AcrR family transcriptional regulator [Aliivibrio finisterrensis]
MARRNDHTHQEIRDMALDNVKVFLNEHSHHELSLRKLAKSIGYVPSTLVNIFGSYNLLLLRSIAQTLDELMQQVNQGLDNSTTPEEALKAIAYCYYDFAQRHPNRWKLVFQHNMNGEALPDWQENRISQMMGVLEEIIKTINSHKSDSDVEKSSRVIWASVHGITLLSLDDLLFSSTPIDGHLLIDNLLLNYINQWKQH